MTDRINEIEEQAKVMLEWCRQQRELPEKEKRDILEYREIGDPSWHVVSDNPAWCIDLLRYRLRKRPKKHAATVYWWRDTDGLVIPSLRKHSGTFLGTSTVEFTEPQE